MESLLGWDQQVLQPPAASEYRSDQVAWLSTRAHARWASPEIGEALSRAEELTPETLTADQRANLREWRRSYDRACCLPERLVDALARATSLAHPAWVQARRDSDFSLFAPHLEKLVTLSREQADCWRQPSPMPRLETAPSGASAPSANLYQALLETYEPGVRSADLASLFDTLAPTLTELVLAGEARPAPAPLPPGPYPLEKQIAFNHRVIAACGFDFSAGRIDPAPHPFCTTLGPRDIRLTTRYREDDFTESLFCLLHEVGHGLYEQGLPPEKFGTPVGQAVSLGLHESQSRLWENHVGRSLVFWQHWFPVACESFPQLRATTPENLVAHLRQVRRSFIRVEADTVSYDLHIILRFRLEVRLIEGSLAVADLPAAWNEAFRQLFGLSVPDDAHGCLQDIHWSGASFGYFPTYTLGNLQAAQIFQTVRHHLPGLDRELAGGQYQSLRQWLAENIHAKGQLLSAPELMEKVTGRPTETTDHLNYLRDLSTA